MRCKIDHVNDPMHSPYTRIHMPMPFLGRFVNLSRKQPHDVASFIFPANQGSIPTIPQNRRRCLFSSPFTTDLLMSIKRRISEMREFNSGIQPGAADGGLRCDASCYDS